MKFKAATCEKCGAPLSFDNTQQVLFCEHCGSSYLIENDKHDEQAEALKRAEQWLQLKNWQKAKESFLQVLDYNPTDADAWYGVVAAVTKNFTDYLKCYRDEIDELEQYWHSAIAVDLSDQQFNKLISYMQGAHDAHQENARRFNEENPGINSLSSRYAPHCAQNIEEAVQARTANV